MTTPYRLEMRGHGGDLIACQDRHGVTGEPLTAASGWDLLRAATTSLPEFFGPHAGRRMVLLGPDRTPLADS